MEVEKNVCSPSGCGLLTFITYPSGFCFVNCSKFLSKFEKVSYSFKDLGFIKAM